MTVYLSDKSVLSPRHNFNYSAAIALTRIIVAIIIIVIRVVIIALLPVTTTVQRFLSQIDLGFQ